MKTKTEVIKCGPGWAIRLTVQEEGKVPAEFYCEQRSGGVLIYKSRAKADLACKKMAAIVSESVKEELKANAL